jgi:hypothetical protein
MVINEPGYNIYRLSAISMLTCMLHWYV